MPTIENMTDQEWRLTALLPDPKNKAKDAEPIPVVVVLDRAVARKAWDAMKEEERAKLPREPIVVRDLAALAQDAGVEVSAVLATLKRDALVRAALADGRLVLTEG